MKGFYEVFYKNLAFGLAIIASLANINAMDSKKFDSFSTEIVKEKSFSLMNNNAGNNNINNDSTKLNNIIGMP